MNRLVKASAALAAAALIAGPALAQQQPQQRAAMPRHQPQQAQLNLSSMGNTNSSQLLPVITGQVVALREVGPQGRQGHRNSGAQQIALALIRTPGSQQPIVADLGLASAIPNNLKGKQVSVSGLPAPANGRLVFLANTVDVNGKTINVQRPQPPQNVQPPQLDQAQGKVVKTENIQLRNGAAPTVIALVDTQNGPVTVDLGTANELGLNVQQGMTIDAKGHQITIGNRPVLLANQVQANNQTYVVSNSPI